MTGLGENSVKHRFSKPAGKRILLTRMIGKQ